jgi:hypothetical protein
MTKIWLKTVVIIVFFITSAISFYRFGNFSLDLDEIFTVDYAQSINSLNYWEYFDWDLGNPPLFFFLLNMWTKVSLIEPWLRLLPWLFWTASLYYTNKLLRLIKVSPQIRSLSLVLIMGIGAYEYLSVYVRAYSLLLLLAVVSMYLSAKLTQDSAKKIDYTMLVAVVVAGFYTHYVYWAFAAFWVIIYLIVSIKSKPLSSLYKTISAFVLGGLFSMQIIMHVIARELLSDGEKYDWWQIEGLHRPLSSTWLELLKFPHHVFSEKINETLGILFWVSFLALAKLSLKNISSNAQKVIISFSMIFWPIYIMTPLKDYFSPHKYIALFMFIFTISMACILENKPFVKMIMKHNKILVVCTLLFAVWAILPSSHLIQGGDDWKLVISKLEKEYRNNNFKLVVDCIEAPAFYRYLKEDIILYGSSELPSRNDCELEPIEKNLENFENIKIVTSWQIPPLSIQKTYHLANFSEEHWPIVIATYQKNK